MGHYSLVLFFHLKMANERSLSWMTQEPEEWDKDVDYCIFQDFVKKMDVTALRGKYHVNCISCLIDLHL